MTTIVVAGPVAAKRGLGGSVWVRMSWAEGLRALGFDVLFVEEGQGLDPGAFHTVMAEFGFTGDAALVTDGSVHGMSEEELHDRAAGAALLVNLGGHLRSPHLRALPRRSAFVDLDPGYTQLWDAERLDVGLDGHDLYFTVGINVGTPRCPLPGGDRRWRPVRQPVVLDRWPCADAGFSAFTTVGSWRGAYGPLRWRGRTLGPKAHEFRRVANVPATAGLPFTAALDIHPDDADDRRRLLGGGWRIVSPETVAAPVDFARFVRTSGAEFSAAQGVYVHTRSGWFSDRSVRYLASGRPVLVQDTGFGHDLPVGEGLLTFRSAPEAAILAKEVATNHARHAPAARAIAEEYFAHDRALAPLLEAL